MNRFSVAILSGFFLSGCTSPEQVLFVTKTNLGVDVEPKTTSLDIGFTRVEGYLAPRFKDGVAPPVVATFKKDDAFFPNVMQKYATGHAASMMADKTIFLDAANRNMAAERMSDDEDMMFVGTSTTIGLRGAFEASIPEFSFGYKRREFSLIPLYRKKKTDGSYQINYPSVVASLGAGVIGKDKAVDGLEIEQFFAVGHPAEAYARTARFDEFISSKAGLFPNYEQNRSAQVSLSAEVMACYEKAKPADQVTIWKDASNRSLTEVRDKTLFDRAGDSEDARKKADKRYRFRVKNLLPTSDEHVVRLEAHKKVVCNKVA